MYPCLVCIVWPMSAALPKCSGSRVIGNLKSTCLVCALISFWRCRLFLYIFRAEFFAAA